MNDLLREHVTRVGFDLTLTKTQVCVMVYLDVLAKAHVDRDYPLRGDAAMPKTSPSIPAMLDRTFVPAVQGCIRRGLMTHHWNDSRKYNYLTGEGLPPIWKIYRFTKAGKLMIGLLREAGIYDDYAAPLIAAFVTPIIDRKGTE